MRKSLFLVVSETYFPLRDPVPGNEIEKKYLKLLYYEKMAISAVFETYFPLRGPIPGNVMESNPFPLQPDYIST